MKTHPKESGDRRQELEETEFGGSIRGLLAVLIGLVLLVVARSVTPPSRPLIERIARRETVDRTQPKREHAPQRESPEGPAELGALRTWAEVEPAAALMHARRLTGERRLAALIAALEGAAKQPALAIRLATELLNEEPELASDCGPALVGALIRGEAFDAALEFASRGPIEQRSAWLAAVFGSWVEREPRFAREVVALFNTRGIEGPAYQTLVEHWAATDPAAAVAYAFELSRGTARSAVMQAALPSWAARDPAAVIAVLPHLTEPAERDAALFAIVSGTDALDRPTNSALTWSEAITDPVLRQRSLARVLQEWAQREPAAAESYVSTNPRLSAPEREALRFSLRPRPPSADT